MAGYFSVLFEEEKGLNLALVSSSQPDLTVSLCTGVGHSVSVSRRPLKLFSLCVCVCVYFRGVFSGGMVPLFSLCYLVGIPRVSSLFSKNKNKF